MCQVSINQAHEVRGKLIFDINFSVSAGYSFTIKTLLIGINIMQTFSVKMF